MDLSLLGVPRCTSNNFALSQKGSLHKPSQTVRWSNWSWWWLAIKLKPRYLHRQSQYVQVQNTGFGQSPTDHCEEIKRSSSWAWRRNAAACSTGCWPHFSKGSGAGGGDLGWLKNRARCSVAHSKRSLEPHQENSKSLVVVIVVFFCIIPHGPEGIEPAKRPCRRYCWACCWLL